MNINESADERDVDQIDKENINKSNNDTVVIALMEEILISAVRIDLPYEILKIHYTVTADKSSKS